jgi:hypothetical protein
MDQQSSLQGFYHPVGKNIRKNKEYEKEGKSTQQQKANTSRNIFSITPFLITQL